MPPAPKKPKSKSKNCKPKKSTTPTPSSIDADADDAAVYAAILGTANNGMWVSQINKEFTNLSTKKVTKICGSLVDRGKIKVVYDLARPKMKKFMASDFEPSANITGGHWYLKGAINNKAVSGAMEHCLRQFHGDKGMTIEMIQKGEYSQKHIEEIVEMLVLDGNLECEKSDGNAGVLKGEVWYYKRKKGFGDGVGVWGMIPCAVCPRISECSPDGVISPKTCVYYRKWLNLEF